MPQVYSKYANQLSPYLGAVPPHQAQPIQIPQLDQVQLNQTPGGRVLATHPGNNFAALFNAVTNNIYNDHQWQWDPSAAGAYTVNKTLDALDGTRTSGECKILAAVLLALWSFPPPFGLGQGGASLYLYNNNNANDGFIAHHPMAGVRGLRPNIMHPFGTPQDLNTRQPLYAWGDHKVVLHNGIYYDPSYKTTYNGPNDMLGMEYTGAAHPVNDVYPVRIHSSNVAKGWIAGQTMYMRFDLLGGGWKGPYREIA